MREARRRAATVNIQISVVHQHHLISVARSVTDFLL